MYYDYKYAICFVAEKCHTLQNNSFVYYYYVYMLKAGRVVSLKGQVKMKVCAMFAKAVVDTPRKDFKMEL